MYVFHSSAPSVTHICYLIRTPPGPDDQLFGGAYYRQRLIRRRVPSDGRRDRRNRCYQKGSARQEVQSEYLARAVHVLATPLGLLTDTPLVLVQNRELQIMRQLEHPNIVPLKHCFYSNGEKVCFPT
jgi:hypothetical protein